MDEMRRYEPELAKWIMETYGLQQVHCIHVRSWTNDVYFVESLNGKAVLKLYAKDGRSRSEVLWETELLAHLIASGAPVSGVVSAPDGNAVKDCELAGSMRNAVLFQFAPGDKPAEPFTEELYYNEGRALATVHLAADSFTSSQSRPMLDTDYLITEPVSLVASYMVNEDDKRFLLAFAEQTAHKIKEFAAKGLDAGPVHGDATLDNLHVDFDGKVIWFDFDSGGPGWRAIDLQGWALLEDTPDFLAKREQFLKGYREVRPIGENDLAASPYLHIANEMWGVKTDLVRLWATGDQNAVQANLQENIAKLRNRLKQLQKLTR